MTELEIILSSGVAGGLLSQLGAKLIDKFVRDKRADKSIDIANIDAVLEVNNKLIEQFKEIIDDLRQEICMRYSCDLRLSGNKYFNLKNIIENGSKKNESKGSR